MLNKGRSETVEKSIQTRPRIGDFFHHSRDRRRGYVAIRQSKPEPSLPRRKNAIESKEESCYYRVEE